MKLHYRWLSLSLCFHPAWVFKSHPHRGVCVCVWVCVCVCLLCCFNCCRILLDGCSPRPSSCPPPPKSGQTPGRHGAASTTNSPLRPLWKLCDNIFGIHARGIAGSEVMHVLNLTKYLEPWSFQGAARGPSGSAMRSFGQGVRALD